MDKKVVTEIVEFDFVQSLSYEESIRIINNLEEKFHSQQEGFISTELVKGKGQRWVMIQHWDSMENLKAASKLMMKEAVTEEFRQAIDPTSVKMQLLVQVQVWNK